MWPGFGDNMRVLDWIIKRCTGEVDALETPIGFVPVPGDLNLDGIHVPAESMEALFNIDREAWKVEISEIGEYLESYGERTPEALKAEQKRVAAGLM